MLEYKSQHHIPSEVKQSQLLGGSFNRTEIHGSVEYKQNGLIIYFLMRGKKVP